MAKKSSKSKAKPSKLDSTNIMEMLRVQYGDDIVSFDEGSYEAFIPDGIPTGLLCMDLAIGRPGIPVGRMSEIEGEDQSGKTALALQIIKQALYKDYFVFIADTEKRYDRDRFITSGITHNTDRMAFIRSLFLEDLFSRIDKIIYETDDSVPLLFVVDSVAGSSCRAEVEADYEDESYAQAARALAKSFRKIIPVISTPKRRVCVLLVNQLKTRIKRTPYEPGGKFTLYGGYAIKYHATLRMKTDSRAIEDENEEVSALMMKVTLVKNSIADPFKQARLQLNFGRGFDRYRDLFEAGLRIGIIQKKGNKGGWYEYVPSGDSIRSTDWVEYVDGLGGIEPVYEFMTAEAVDLGLIIPYGINPVEEDKEETEDKED